MNYKVTFFLLCLVLATSVQAQSPYYLKEKSLSISGTSTLHEWESDATQLEWTGTILVEDSKIIEVKNVQVKIPVTSIKSTKGRIMDNKTYEAFDSDKNPYITYKLTKLEVSGSGSEFTLSSTGNLTMAGTTRSVDIPVSAKILSTGDIQLTGSRKLNMRDFKMEPPTAIMGTIVVGEVVTVNFNLIVSSGKSLTKAN